MIEDVSGDYYGVFKQEARLAEEVSDNRNVTLGCVHKDFKGKDGKLCKLNLHEGKAGNSIERTCRLPLRILESTRIRPFPSIGPSTDATLRSMTAKFSPGSISPSGVLLFGVLMETVSSFPGLCDERSYCSLTGPHTGSDPDGSEGEMSRYADGYTMRAVTSKRPMQTGVFGKALSSVVCCAEGNCGC
jgi:hypothetical protein